LGAVPLFLGAAVVLPTLAIWFAHELRPAWAGQMAVTKRQRVTSI